jgi:mannobiose 2-epimerase
MMHRRLPSVLIAFGVAALHAGNSSPSAAPLDASGPTPGPALSTPVAGGLSVDPNSLRTYSARVEAELKTDILPFWLRHTRDRKRGGFFGEISNDLVVKEDAPRGALLTSRILWTFSAAYRRYQDPAYLEMARWAYDDLLTKFWDKEQGGLFWSITADGKPLDTRKLIYGQAFGIYALSEYHRATGDHEPLDRAIALYRTVESHSRDLAQRGYFEEFTREWKRLSNARWSRFRTPGPKSQNTHLHVMEAYANLLRVWPDPELRGNLRDLVDVMLARILDPANHHLRLFLADDWTPRTDGISYGHDIEFSWLLLETAEVLGDHDLIARTKTVALDVARATLAEGVDADGGLLSEAGPTGLTNTNKEWWQQAEAVTGFFNAYQLSGDPRFLQASRHCWNFIASHVVDRTHGEWYNLLARDGTVLSRDKVSLWKCPYHDGRTCMEMVSRIDAMLGAAPPVHRSDAPGR